MSRLSDHYRVPDAPGRGRARSHLTVAGTMHEIGYHEGEIDADTPTHPQTLYGIAKNALREALEVELRGGPVTFQWLRCFYIYGDDEANSSIFTKIAQAAERGDPTFPFTTGADKFDFIEVHELAAQIAAVASQSQETGIINCCSGTPESLAHRAESFIAERGYDIRLEYGAFPDRPFESPATWGERRRDPQDHGLRHLGGPVAARERRPDARPRRRIRHTRFPCAESSWPAAPAHDCTRSLSASASSSSRCTTSR